LFRSTDGGTSWVAGDTINTNIHVDQHAMLFPSSMKGSFIAGNDGGVFRTGNYVASKLYWTAHNQTLSTLEIYNCAMHPFDPDTVIVGCQDNGYDKFHNDPYNWLVVGGDGFCSLYDQQQPGYFYHEYTYMNLHRADNGFTWWSAKKMSGLPTDSSSGGFYSGIITPDRSDWYGQGITMSPADSRILYYGTNHLYKTTDRADNWNLVTDQEFASTTNDYITALHVATKQASRIYVGTENGSVYCVSDLPAQVLVNDITPSGGTGDRIRGLITDPRNASIVYVNGSTNGGKMVMKSTDAGAIWTAKSSGLPNTNVQRIVADPDSANTVYAATGVGLYVTRDGGDHWRIVPGLPNVEIWDIAFHKPTRTILLGTYGRGAIRCAHFVPPDTANVKDTVTDTTSIVSSRPALPQAALISVYPQPVSEGASITVVLPRSAQTTLTLTDMVGRVIATLYSGTMQSGEQTLELGRSTIASLPRGCYVVQLASNGSVVSVGRLVRR
jgi:hypothetical protein